MKIIELQKELQPAATKKILKELENFIEERKMNLWGQKRPTSFKKVMLYLTLYKDLYGKSDLWIYQHQPKNYHLSKESLQHNIKEMRRILDQWAETVIGEPSFESLKQAAKNVTVHPSFTNGMVNCDSSDFLIGGSSWKCGPKDEYWSYKENHAAFR